jgi:hypothetical protein
MTHPMPPNAPAMIRDQAELTDLRFIVQQMVYSHDRYVQRTSNFRECLCSLCRRSRPWVIPQPVRFCASINEHEEVS